MKKEDCTIGMRVRAIAPCCGLKSLVGKHGTIRKIVGASIGVEFDEPFKDGHTLNGLLSDVRSRGRWCEVESLMPCDAVDITIRSNGKGTTIKGTIHERTIDKSVRCSKKDTPNVYVGALMALNKAFGVHLGRAKTGENVIVINPIDPHDKYSLGDIVKMDNDIQGTNIKNNTLVTLFATEYAIIDDISILAKPGKPRKVVCVAVDKSDSPFVVGKTYTVDPDNTISLADGKVCVVHDTNEQWLSEGGHWLAEGKNKFVVINEDGKNKD